MAKKQSEKTEKDSSEKRLLEVENHLKRALADYANLQKRTEGEKKTLIGFANSVLVTKLLEILDGLEAAEKESPTEGLKMVIRKFKDVLRDEGVEEISTEEGKFNPELHEGVGVVEGESDGKIASVLQKGYSLKGRILRPARVAVTTTTIKES